MSFRLRCLFDLDRQLRIYLRFFIESFSIFVVYILCVTTSDVLGQLSIATHVANAVLWLLLYQTLGLHKDRLRFSSVASYLPILKVSLISGSILVVESLVFAGGIDILTLLLYLLLSINILLGFRVLARQLIRREANRFRENILVYGTSDIAIDFVNAIAFGRRYNVVGFISDKPQSIGSLASLPVLPFVAVEEFARVHACQLVVLATESLTPARQTEVLLDLDKMGLSVSYAPTMDRAFDYEVQLKAVKPEEVLGRASEIQFDDSLQAELDKKTVLVTGAGGSIGSEICRQILRYQPEKLVILELNEFALYNLEQEILGFSAKEECKTQCYYYLGSVTDEAILTKIFNEQNIQIVYHAAAYKHVPIVENNIIVGIKNNVFGTKCVADFSHRFGVDKFVLVSTDKAVRPTNIMGASKRLAELVIQQLSKTSETKFTLVRFGNVLGSSGSVIPKFKLQINDGGPITVTHEEITRYFMSISEAAHLVLNAGLLATGGDVFLLDMGDPVKIVELAKSMVRQHGLQPVLASETTGRKKRDNEILIEFTGLRPGEKLYEELLINGDAQKTSNPKIFKSDDGILDDFDLSNCLEVLDKLILNGSTDEIIKQLLALPLSYAPSANLTSTQNKFGELYESKTEQSEITEVKYTQDDVLEREEHRTLLKRVISSRLGLAVLHHYFLMTRGMTLGVRVIVQNREGKILIVQHSYVHGWHLPGGGVDRGEDIETAARREVYEETGISELDGLQLICIHHNNEVSDRDHVTYFVAKTDQTPTTEKNSEITEIRFVARDVALEIVTPEHQRIILENT